MNTEEKTHSTWKEKAVREFVHYWMTFGYLVFFFGAFTWYHRLVLQEYQITYLHYGLAVVESLVLAKVILIGDALRLGQRLESRPLIWSTLYKAVIFTLWVALFKAIEFTLTGVLHHESIISSWYALVQKAKSVLLANSLVVFFAFIPFFAFRELGRLLGEGTLARLFFKAREPKTT